MLMIIDPEIPRKNKGEWSNCEVLDMVGSIINGIGFLSLEPGKCRENGTYSIRYRPEQ